MVVGSGRWWQAVVDGGRGSGRWWKVDGGRGSGRWWEGQW